MQNILKSKTKKSQTDFDKEQRKDKREGAKLGLEIAKELDKSSE